MKRVILTTICLAIAGNAFAQRPPGMCLSLDGNEDLMQLSDYADSLIFDAPVTIEFWLKTNFDHKSGSGFIWNLNDGNPVATSGAESFELRYGSNTGGLTNERLTIFYSLGTLANSNTFGVEDNGMYRGQWHHYAVVADSANYRVYIDGVEQTLTPSSSSGNGIARDYGAGITPKENVALGARYLNNGPNFEFDGFIDEFRIWNVVRDSIQIQSTMNDTLGPEYYGASDSGLVGYWRFDELEDLGVNGDGADDIRDFSVYGYHGDLGGDANLQAFGLPGVEGSSVAWGDYDNDGDLDILLTGGSSSGNISRIYRNDTAKGMGFTDINAALVEVSGGSVAWGDYDNDGDLDILLTGEDNSDQGVSKIYRNDNGSFTDINAPLVGVGAGSVAWGDYDNDGDLDILLTGLGSLGSISTIYRNDTSVGMGFTDINPPFSEVILSSVAWGDYDNDMDLDVLLTGRPSSGLSVSSIYRNDTPEGMGFTDIVVSLFEVDEGSVAWGDFDNEGDLDILLSGFATGIGISRIFQNNDDGVFSEINAALTGVFSSSVAWGDHDNDGDLDILLTGVGNSGIISKIYRNDDSTFVDINAPLAGVGNSSVAWGDYDNDGDLDILLTGSDSISNDISRVYRNDISQSNTLPTAPTNLSASVTDTTVLLSWDAASDAETPSPGLTYNLRIGTTPGGSEIMSPMASSSGYRRVAQLGNVNHNLSWTIRQLQSNTTYYWSVQVVDNSFAGGTWAPEQNFTTMVTGIEDQFANVPKEFYLGQNYPNPFNPITKIRFGLPKTSRVQIGVFNVLGQEVTRLFDGEKLAGDYVVEFDGTELGSGLYIYRMQTEEFIQIRKMLLIQ